MTNIEYTVVLDAPQTQTAEIRMVVRNITTPTVDLALPVWRTGRYAVLNPAGTLSRVRSALPISKIDKTTWRVQTDGSSEIEVRYTLYANSLGDRTRHIDDTHAFLSGATVFLYVPDRRNEAVSVHIDAPAHWNISCGLDAAKDNPRTLLAPSYDALTDAPIEAGIHDVLHFDVDGIPHEIMLWGAPPYDGEKLKKDFAAIVRNESELFGGLPYSRYIFMLHVGPGLRGGTEHFNSTIIQVPPDSFDPVPGNPNDASYKRMLGTVSHEMFHVWNVKRLRPAALAHTDFAHENYTDLLWFCEGTTAYFDELVLARTGLVSADAFLLEFGELLHQVRRRPGSQVQSVAESSFDAWIKFNQPTSDDMNTTVSFYDSGAVATFMLDLELRARSGNSVSMDTLMREMVAQFPVTGPGFTTADLIDVASRLAGSRLDEFFARYIHSTDSYPLESKVGILGLQLALDAPGMKSYTGLIAQDQNGSTLVRYVLSDGPAYLAGVLPGDEIVALNGKRCTATELTARVEMEMNPGDTAQLEVLRRGRQRIVEFKLGSLPKGRWRLTRIPAPTASQRAAYTSWLQQTW